MVTAAQALDAYDRLTEQRTRFVRLDELCERASDAGVLPSKKELEKEAARAQKDKAGLERAQGEFLSHVLGDPAAGAHLCHAMLLPHPRTAEFRAVFEKNGRIEFPGARLQR